MLHGAVLCFILRLCCSTVPSAPDLDTPPTVTATTITISGSVPADGSVVGGFVVQWQRVTCPGAGDEGSMTGTGSFTSYEITGLDEGNMYTVTVNASNSAGTGLGSTVDATTTEIGNGHFL